MHIALKILLALLSTSALLCLSIYIYLANRGRSLVLYSSVDSRLMSFGTRPFFAFAAVALLVCLYRGAEIMLFWLPSSWGYADEYGQFTKLQETLALLFAFLGGLTLINFIDKSVCREFYLRDINIECRELNRIINASHSESALRYLIDEYEKERSSLQTEYLEIDRLKQLSEPLLLPQAQTFFVYRDLISLAEKQISRIQSK